MPKREIIHKAGEPVGDEIRGLIERYFNLKQIEKLQRLGGRILISVAAPYKPKQKVIQKIDEEFISNLRAKRQDFNGLKQTLDQLSTKQLKELCAKLSHPLKTGTTLETIKRELIRSLQAEDYWNNISRE
jgi:hypothetical protein